MSDAEDVIELYRRHARDWAADRGALLLEQAWLARFVGDLPPRPHILDLGCGSGDPIARYLLANHCMVTGIDTSSEFVAMCRQKFPDQTWCVHDMRTLSLGRWFDGVLAWDSLFHLTPDDQRRMFAVFGAHVTSGGALMFTSGPGAGVAIGSYRGAPVYHASLDAGEYRRLLDAHGFEVREHVVQDRDCGGRTIWLAGRR